MHMQEPDPQEQNSVGKECETSQTDIPSDTQTDIPSDTQTDIPLYIPTEKEKLILQRKENERALKEFKGQIKVWILDEIPQD